METLTWFLTFVILFIWGVVAIGLLRRPPRLPGVASGRLRRAVWGGAAILALVAGGWGPELWSTTATDHAAAPASGAPVELSEQVIRTPFAVRTVRAQRDVESRPIFSERRLALQLPVALLAFLGLVGGVRMGLIARGAGRTVVLLLPFVWAGCGEPSFGEQAPRPDRQIVEVAWDTLVYIELDVQDTLVYGAERVVAGERGFWLLDRAGYRVAHFDWAGTLQWYAGRQGGGPGEFLNPRALSLDSRERVWVLDLNTRRATAFGTDGEFDGALSLAPLDGVLHDFSIGADGDRVHGMIMGEGLIPVSVDLEGRVETGAQLQIREVDELFGIALQGVVAGDPRSDRWIYAFLMGDGFFLMDGVEPTRERQLYPEFVPFPGMMVAESEGPDASSRTVALTEPRFAAAAATIASGRLMLRFRGETEHSGRLLDLFDLETGAYLESLLLPRPGQVAAWDDRIVQVWNDPAPRILVIRRP